MAGESIESILTSHPFLAGMSPAQWATVAQCAGERCYEAGEHLTREGEPAAELYLIWQGQVAVETRLGKRGSVRLETLHGGDVLGWSSLTQPYRWLFDSRALSPVSVVVLDGTCLQRHCETDHELGYELLLRIARVIESRLQATRLHLIDVQQPQKS